MIRKNNPDYLGIMAFVFTFISLFFAFNLNREIFFGGLALIVLAVFVYLYDSVNKRLNYYHKSVERLNEKINIFERLSRIEEKVRCLKNE